MNTNNIRTDCWDKALDALGYFYIYSKRIEKLELWLRWTKVLGILIPVLLGGLVTSYFSNKLVLSIAITVTTPLALLQLLLSTYLAITGSDEKMSEYSTTAAEYALLNSEFEQLAKYPIEDEATYLNRYNVLLERERGVGKRNFNISDKERRMGMRYGLRQYRRGCAGCNETPVSMNPTTCDVCGNF